jgi:hypothetical protein
LFKADYITFGHIDIPPGTLGNGKTGTVRTYEVATGAVFPPGRYVIGSDRKLYFHQTVKW